MRLRVALDARSCRTAQEHERRIDTFLTRGSADVCFRQRRCAKIAALRRRIDPALASGAIRGRVVIRSGTDRCRCTGIRGSACRRDCKYAAWCCRRSVRCGGGRADAPRHYEESLGGFARDHGDARVDLKGALDLGRLSSFLYMIAATTTLIRAASASGSMRPGSICTGRNAYSIPISRWR